MSYTYQTRTYFYCDGYSGKTVSVTMGIPSTTQVEFTTQLGCNIRREKKTFTFQLANPIPVDLVVRYSVQYNIIYDYDYMNPAQGLYNSQITFLAGQTYKTVEFIVKEETWCSTSDGGVRIQTIV